MNLLRLVKTLGSIENLHQDVRITREVKKMFEPLFTEDYSVAYKMLDENELYELLYKE